MSLLFSVLISIFFGVQNDWPVYFENDQIKISFKDVICDDIKNGVSFEYYMIEVKNKTLFEWGFGSLKKYSSTLSIVSEKDKWL